MGTGRSAGSGVRCLLYCQAFRGAAATDADLARDHRVVASPSSAGRGRDPPASGSTPGWCACDCRNHRCWHHVGVLRISLRSSPRRDTAQSTVEGHTREPAPSRSPGDYTGGALEIAARIMPLWLARCPLGGQYLAQLHFWGGICTWTVVLFAIAG